MPKEQKRSENQNGDQQKSMLNRLFSKRVRDDNYISDLKAQWAELDRGGRVKFVLGALVGMCLFFGALILAYLALSAMIR